MATNITTLLSGSITSTMEKTTVPAAPAGATDLDSTSSDPYFVQATNSFEFGAGSDKAKGHIHGTWTCAAGAQLIFDMAGTLEDVFGDTITATEVKAIYIKNLSTTPADKLEVFGDAAAGGNAMPIVKAAGDALVIGPSGWVLLSNPIDGYAVGAGATDDIEISNPGGNDIDCEVAIVYEHA